MTQINFLITPEKANEMTWEEMESLMEGNIVRARGLIARFMVDENDQPLDYEQARKILGGLKLPEIKGAVEQFAAAMKDSAVNPTNASK